MELNQKRDMDFLENRLYQQSMFCDFCFLISTFEHVLRQIRKWVLDIAILEEVSLMSKPIWMYNLSELSHFSIMSNQDYMFKSNYSFFSSSKYMPILNPIYMYSSNKISLWFNPM